MALLRDIKDNENNTYSLTTSIINNISADKLNKESLEISKRSMKLAEDSVKLARGANILAVVSIIYLPQLRVLNLENGFLKKTPKRKPNLRRQTARATKAARPPPYHR